MRDSKSVYISQLFFLRQIVSKKSQKQKFKKKNTKIILRKIVFRIGFEFCLRKLFSMLLRIISSYPIHLVFICSITSYLNHWFRPEASIKLHGPR